MIKNHMTKEEVSRLQSEVDKNPNSPEGQKEFLKKAQSQADKSFHKNIT